MIYKLRSMFMHIVFISDILSKVPIFKDALSLLIPIMDQQYTIGCALASILASLIVYNKVMKQLQASSLKSLHIG